MADQSVCMLYIHILLLLPLVMLIDEQKTVE